jgi:hypothetical protein
MVEYGLLRGLWSSWLMAHMMHRGSFGDVDMRTQNVGELKSGRVERRGGERDEKEARRQRITPSRQPLPVSEYRGTSSA